MQTRRTVRYLAWIAVFAATAAAAAAAETSPCGAIDGAASVIGPGTIVLVGEMHGTEQSPPFVADLACTALARELSVTVALEIPEEEEPLVTAYLDSDGGEAARAALLSGPFWTDDYQDGRRSEAELELIESLRRDRRAGLPVRVALLDRRTWKEPAERDAHMASRLADAAKASPRDLVVSLTGNLHSRIRKGTPWNADYRPMGLELKEALTDRRVVALDVAYTSGTAWNCRSDEAESCHPYELEGTRTDGTGPRRIVLDDGAEEKRHDGYYTVGRLSASAPAVASRQPAGRE